MKTRIAALALAASLMPHAHANAAELIFGISTALSGDYAPYAEAEGAKCMADKLTKAAGPDDPTIKLLIEDNRSDAQLSVSLGQKFLDEGAQIVTGVPFPDALIPITQIATGYNAIVFSPPNTNVEMFQSAITNFFTVSLPDPINAAATADAVYAKGARNAVILTSADGGSWTEKLPEWFAEVFEKNGGKVVSRIKYSFGTTDWSPQIAQIKALETPPDVIEISSILPDVGILIRQLRANGYTGWVVGSDGFDDKSLEGTVGEAASLEKVMFASNGVTQMGNSTDAFLDQCKKDGFKVNGVFDALAADMILVTFEAAKAAATTDAAKLGEALRAAGGYKGVTADKISFAEKLSYPIKPVPVIGFKDGKRILITDQFPAFAPTFN